MSGALAFTGETVRAHRRRWAAILAGFVVFYYAALTAAMLIRFGNLPNYVTFYDWPANLWHIFASTPSLTDAIVIAHEEWLIEIGFMNYAYGHGISEWSVTVWPTKFVLVVLVGVLVATCGVLVHARSRVACSVSARRGALAATGGGAFLVGLSSATLSWVVCCATPTWVVSLALLGMSPGLALWLEPLGGAMVLLGYAMLGGAVYWLARSGVTSLAEGAKVS